MKEICIINYRSDAANYGIGTYLKYYRKAISNLDYSITLINLGFKSNDKLYVEMSNQIKEIYIPYILNSETDEYNRGVGRIIRKYIHDSPDLIFHFNYLQSKILLEHIKPYYPKSKKILTIHYLYWSAVLNGDVNLFIKIITSSKKYADKYKKIITNYEEEKAFFHMIDHIICLSEDTHHLIHTYYGLKNTHLALIPNGITKSNKNKIAQRKNFLLHESEKIILFVGRIHRVKGIYPFINAMINVIKSYGNCRLIIIGDGDINSLFMHTKEICAKITFTGILTHNELYQWYKIADLAVFPSFYEECSYVGIEMMMHGLPIIASDGYSVHCMFKDCALITPIGNRNNLKEYEKQLEQNILKVLNDDNLRSELAGKSLEQYKNKYTLKHMSNKYKELLQSI